MPRFAFLPMIIREKLATRDFPREPEPDLVMADEEQVRSYSLAGRIDGVMSAAYLFQSGHVSSVIHGARTVIDLGCGPATQLVQIAQLNKESDFIGVDLSPTMLESARAYVAESGAKNISFRQGDISHLESFGDHSADAIISTMTLHHLPTRDRLDACFREIKRVLKPGGAVYLTDFGRLKSLSSIITFAYMNAEHQPHLFSLDYERSLRAAFLFEELSESAREYLPDTVRSYRTFALPLLVILQTPDRLLPAPVLARLGALKAALPRKYRRDLGDLRLFFRMGGLSDSFSEIA